jgi:hypothetical protein
MQIRLKNKLTIVVNCRLLQMTIVHASSTEVVALIYNFDIITKFYTLVLGKIFRENFSLACFYRSWT